jgi:UDP-N-acetylmuramyl pentapeptide synthase
MKAAIDVLAAQAGEKLLVLGDMGELGDDSPRMHAEIGSYAANAGIASLYTLGELSERMASAFGAGAQHFTAPEALAEALTSRMSNTAVVLVKGSRFMRMERVVKLITTENAGEEH